MHRSIQVNGRLVSFCFGQEYSLVESENFVVVIDRGRT